MPVSGMDNDPDPDKKKRASKKGDDDVPKQAQAIEIENNSVSIDGRLDDEVWANANFLDQFFQRTPDEGAAATERTEVAFVFDENALYIGARMYSSNPDEIQATVARRDQGFNSERLIISLDTYLDRRTAYSFSISASGVRGDYFHPQDESRNRDFSYDPVWIANARIDSLGWTAEMRIPFSQLRFEDKEEQDWGLNINRFIPNKNEDDFWVVVPQNENGWSSRFGNLRGIKNVTPSKRIEFIPYVSSNAFAPGAPDPNNPFLDDVNLETNVGGDVKIGLGPNLNLDVTLNPDFGQVEADPAVVNLSVFEVTFDERRPFFTEGGQLFQSRGAEYFFSRRIGAAPSLSPSADFSEQRSNTRILGASKLTGRLSNGLSVGGLFALTSRERVNSFTADPLNANGGTFNRVEVEPLSSYGVVRLQQEFGPYASTAGVILTGVQRDVNGQSALSDILTEQAYSGGADWNLRFQGGKYQLSGDLGFSHVQGSENAILRLQTRSARFFQRPDASYVNIDSTRTSLSGYRASLNFSKNAGTNWLWGARASANSPGFELNDIGVLRKTDRYRVGGDVTYRENRPGKLFFRYRFNASANVDWNFGGVLTGQRYNLDSRFTFHNFWNTSFSTQFRPRSQSDVLTRGGPLAGRISSWRFNYGLNSNFGAPRQIRLNGTYQFDETGGWQAQVNTTFRVTTSGKLEYSISPRYSRNLNRRQFIQTITGAGPAATFNNRYIFGDIDQSTLSLQLRVNYSFNPNLSLEFYGEPFASSGSFSNPGQLPEARSFDLQRFNVIGRSSDGDNFLVEEAGEQFEVSDPDFLRRSFQSNLVLRYEWRPGSTFFLVWQQSRFNNIDRAPFVDPDDLTAPFSIPGDNVFAIKFTYWFSVN